MNRNFFAVLLLLLATSVHAQLSDEKQRVMEPIERLFKGMHQGDSAMVHSAFVNTVTFVSVYRNKDGKSVLAPEPLNDFLVAVGTPHKEVWSEPVWDVTIQIEGVFAQAWMSYAFYLDNKFSHCGVDAFQLVKDDKGSWKIFHLADTRRRDDCVVPDRVKDRFK